MLYQLEKTLLNYLNPTLMNRSWYELIWLICSSGCRTYISRSTLWITRCGCRGAGSENDTVTYCCKSTINILIYHYMSTSLYTLFCIGWLIITKEKKSLMLGKLKYLYCVINGLKMAFLCESLLTVFRKKDKYPFFSYAKVLLRYRMLIYIYISLALTCKIFEISHINIFFIGWCCSIWRSSLTKCRIKGQY